MNQLFDMVFILFMWTHIRKIKIKLTNRALKSIHMYLNINAYTHTPHHTHIYICKCMARSNI